MRYEDFILLQLLWHFEALRQLNHNKKQATSKSNREKGSLFSLIYGFFSVDRASSVQPRSWRTTSKSINRRITPFKP
jgi:hypothetical protein